MHNHSTEARSSKPDNLSNQPCRWCGFTPNWAPHIQQRAGERIDLLELACEMYPIYMIRWASEGVELSSIRTWAEADLRSAGCEVNPETLGEYLHHLDNEGVGQWCDNKVGLQEAFADLHDLLACEADRATGTEDRSSAEIGGVS